MCKACAAGVEAIMGGLWNKAYLSTSEVFSNFYNWITCVCEHVFTSLLHKLSLAFPTTIYSVGVGLSPLYTVLLTNKAIQIK